MQGESTASIFRKGSTERERRKVKCQYLRMRARLIIIDTLQKVRGVGGDNYRYANDYEVITRLKQFADSYGICILIVHHTKKQGSADKFDMISGTTGLLGASDGAFLLQKEKRIGNTATLEVSGRDQQEQKLYLIRNPETLLWDFQKAGNRTLEGAARVIA